MVAIGLRPGQVDGVEILQGRPELQNIHTITLYLNPQRQAEYYDYMLQLKPKRLVFNPGTENPELMRLAKEQGIEVSIGCMLVMLATQQYWTNIEQGARNIDVGLIQLHYSIRPS